jgi:hypothetical protein
VWGRKRRRRSRLSWTSRTMALMTYNPPRIPMTYTPSLVGACEKHPSYPEQAWRLLLQVAGVDVPFAAFCVLATLFFSQLAMDLSEFQWMELLKETDLGACHKPVTVLATTGTYVQLELTPNVSAVRAVSRLSSACHVATSWPAGIRGLGAGGAGPASTRCSSHGSYQHDHQQGNHPRRVAGRRLVPCYGHGPLQHCRPGARHDGRCVATKQLLRHNRQ